MIDGSLELRKFIENEINLAYTFLDTAAIAGSREHKNQAVLNAADALETARRFAPRLALELTPPEWEARFSDLELRLSKFYSDL